MRHATALAFVYGLLLSGCLHALREPAEDHAVQAEEVARRCRTATSVGGYVDSPCGHELQRHLDELAASARCIEAVAHAEKCE